MLRFFLASPFFLLISSCTNNRTYIYYKYNGTTITRVDFDGATNFYYGYCNNETSTECSETPCIRAEYYGLTNGMELYLVFKNDSTIELVNFGTDNLKKSGDCAINIGAYTNDELFKKIEHYKKAGLGIMRISSAINLEKSFLENKNSKISVEY